MALLPPPRRFEDAPPYWLPPPWPPKPNVASTESVVATESVTASAAAAVKCVKTFIVVGWLSCLRRGGAWCGGGALESADWEVSE